jgi:ubiquinol oxidase
MEHVTESSAFEALNTQLNDPVLLDAYKKPYDTYATRLIPRILGNLLVFCGNVVYGNAPSYLKFRAVEIIARVPYHSWSSATFTLLTLFFSDEKRALQLSYTDQFARFAADNETMHVVVISQLAKAETSAGIIRHTLIPVCFGVFYFWASYLLYLVKPQWSYELNYLFESHAFEQYDQFLTMHGDVLRKKTIMSDFLTWYGRNPISQYDFFLSVRNDEIIHRNQSIEKMSKHS